MGTYDSRKMKLEVLCGVRMPGAERQGSRGREYAMGALSSLTGSHSIFGNKRSTLKK